MAYRGSSSLLNLKNSIYLPVLCWACPPNKDPEAEAEVVEAAPNTDPVLCAAWPPNKEPDVAGAEVVAAPNTDVLGPPNSEFVDCAAPPNAPIVKLSGQNISTREKNYSEMDFEKDKSFPNFRANFYPPFSEESILW